MKLNLLSSITITSLLCVEVLFVSASVRAADPPVEQQPHSIGSYRCGDKNGRNVSRVRLTEQNGVAATLIIDQGNSVVNQYEIADSSSEGGGKSYTAYDANSNATYKFVEYPNGRGTLIFSLEDANGQQQVQSEQTCYKIG